MTEQVRTRTRAPIASSTAAPAGAGRAPAQQSSDDSWMHRGQTADQARAREVERQEQRRANGYAPFRYWLPVGAQGDLIILDNEPGPCFYEHNLPDPSNDGKRTLFEFCPKEFDPCPLCSSDKESYYVMFLSVIDMRPYTKRDGTVVQWSRKLMAIKTQQQPFFVRLHERHGNLRGLHLLMSRDSQTGYANGNPEFQQAHSEEDIMASFLHPERTAQDGRVFKEANADCFPYDYGRIFKRPSGEDLRARYGGVAPAGSTAEAAAEWGGNAPEGGGAIVPATGRITPVASLVAEAEVLAEHRATETAPAAGITPVATTEPAAGIRPAAGAGIQPAAGPAASAVGTDSEDEIPF